MRRFIFTLYILLLAISAAYAQPGASLRPSETVLLYAGSFDGNVDPVYGKLTYAGFRMKEDNDLEGPERISKWGNISNTSDLARFDLYFPEKPNGQMIVVCPGGAYIISSTYNEGLYVADWMLKQGITVAVVKYRMPNGKRDVPYEDVSNTFRYCRAHAEEWGIKNIGIMGFSAGGHLAATASTMWTDKDTRPDFSILMYPVITMEQGYTHKDSRENLITSKAEWNRHLQDKYSMENQVTRFTPPTFIALCSDDRAVPAENSLRYYKRLLDCEVPAEMHIWPKGGHGWGFSKKEYIGPDGNDPFEYAREQFEALLGRWLEQQR